MLRIVHCMNCLVSLAIRLVHQADVYTVRDIEHPKHGCTYMDVELALMDICLVLEYLCLYASINRRCAAAVPVL